jgi:mRNA interferase YafQ
MRTIEYSRNFRRDYRRVKANPRYRNLDNLLRDILDLLAADLPLPPNNRDHALTGDWAGYRECHVRPDLLLIYQKGGNDLLRLARLGSHSELFR